MIDLFSMDSAVAPSMGTEGEAGPNGFQEETSSPHPNANGPISADQQSELVEAKRRSSKVRRVAKVANFNVWSIGIFAALSLPFALFSIKSLLMCIALASVAYNELRGRKMLERFEPLATRDLGWNQLALMFVLIGYSLLNIYVAYTGPGPYAKEIEAMPELGSMLGEVDTLYQSVTLIVYGSLIVASVLFQGLNAAYYFRSQKHVQSYLDQTPAWVVDLQRSTSTV
jgi:hypothetical protein